MNPQKILIIEDDAALRETICDILEAANYEVKDTNNGKEGLAWHKEQLFDLIITDILMPDIDGLEIIMEIREKYPETKLIAISGGGYIASAQYLYAAEKLGSQKVLSKPFENEELISKVNDLLKKKPVI